MTRFYNTDAAADFIDTAESRETSRQVMEAIAFFARDLDEAERIWNGDLGNACTKLDIWEHATSNGSRDVDLFWGAEGERWAEGFGA